MKKALLIGINYINDPDSSLQGCIEDVFLSMIVLEIPSQIGS